MKPRTWASTWAKGTRDRHHKRGPRSERVALCRVELLKTDIPGHYVRQNHSRDLPRAILVLDTETTGTVCPEGIAHTFRLGFSARCTVGPRGTIKEETWRYWTTASELLDYMEKTAPRDGTLWIFANNIFFDLQALGFFRDYPRRGWKLEFVYDAQTSYMLIIKRGRYTIKALSVSNYWAASTRELGELLGEKKLEVSFEDATEEELCIYCFRDTEIALDAMARYFALVHSEDLGAFRLSRAAQSYGAWRHRFMTSRVFCHSSPEVRKLEELAYMGGRVEAYQIGEIPGGPFACYDVNSMYPFIMSRYKLPVKCVDYFTNLAPGDAADVLLGHSCIAEVELETDDPLYAWKYDQKVFFPVGRFTVHLCTEGLRQALIRGHVKRVLRLAAYTDGILFREYIETFWKMRVEAKARGDAVSDRMAKLLMNSLYGKLAQRRPVILSEREIDECDYYRKEIYDMETRGMIITTRLFHRETVTAGDEIVPGAVVSIPAHITEYGRMLQYDIQEKVGRREVLYCDTDSIFIPERPPDALAYPVEKGTIGALSKKWSSEKLVLWGAKDYETDDSVILKGVPNSAEQIGPRMWQYNFWPGQRTHMSERIDDRYMLKEVVKHANSTYDKGRINDDGSISPWVLPDFLSSPESGLLTF